MNNLDNPAWQRGNEWAEYDMSSVPSRRPGNVASAPPFRNDSCLDVNNFLMQEIAFPTVKMTRRYRELIDIIAHRDPYGRDRGTFATQTGMPVPRVFSPGIQPGLLRRKFSGLFKRRNMTGQTTDGGYLCDCEQGFCVNQPVYGWVGFSIPSYRLRKASRTARHGQRSRSSDGLPRTPG